MSNWNSFTTNGNLQSVYQTYTSGQSNYELQLLQAVQTLQYMVQQLSDEVTALKKHAQDTNDLLVQHQIKRIEDELKGS